MGTLLVGIAVLTVVAFANIVRSAGQRGIPPLSLSLVMFVTGMVGSFALLAAGGQPGSALGALSAGALGVALLSGASSAVGTTSFAGAVGSGPTGPAVTISAMSMLISVSASALLFGDRPGHWQVAGAVLSLFSIFLVNLSKPEKHAGGGMTWVSLAVISMLFSGIMQTSWKCIHMVAPALPDLLFLGLSYAASTTLLLLWVASGRARFQRRAVGHGVLLGLVSLLQSYTMVAALRTVPAAVVMFSVLGGGPILVILVSTLVSGERYPKPTWIGVASGIGGIVLMLMR